MVVFVYDNFYVWKFMFKILPFSFSRQLIYSWKIKIFPIFAMKNINCLNFKYFILKNISRFEKIFSTFSMHITKFVKNVHIFVLTCFCWVVDSPYSFKVKLKQNYQELKKNLQELLRWAVEEPEERILIGLVIQC